MTKAQIFYYAAAVAIITLSVYLYTSNDAHAPVANDSQESGGYVSSTQNNESESVITNDTVETLASTTDTVDMGIVTETKYTLTDTNWRWLRTESATGTIVSEPKTAVPFFLKLLSDNSMSSQTDCNSVAGTFNQAGSKLVFGPLMSTKMYCDNSKEFEYTEQLSLVESFEIIDNTLRLELSNEAGTMFFVRTK